MDTQDQPVVISSLTPPANHIRFYKDDVQELMRRCRVNRSVTLAVRRFPCSTYEWSFSHPVIVIARARLAACGIRTEIETVMDEKQSRIIIFVIGSQAIAIGDVSASIESASTTRNPVDRGDNDPDAASPLASEDQNQATSSPGRWSQ